jgi:hypothetical protein
METTIVEKVRALNLPPGQYVVIGSGIMDALGIRAARDIDVAVLPELHAALRATGEWEEEVRYDKVFLKKDEIDLNPQLNWPGYETTTAEAVASATVIDGVPFMNLEELKKFKRALGREKDLADIALIEAYEAAAR